MGSIVIPDPPCGTEACAEALRNLVTAADHRDLIGMAKGLNMARSSCDADEAFAMLRSASQRENTKLWQIAERLVAERTVYGRSARGTLSPA